VATLAVEMVEVMRGRLRDGGAWWRRVTAPRPRAMNSRVRRHTWDLACRLSGGWQAAECEWPGVAYSCRNSY